MAFPYKAYCAYCDEDIRTVRLSNTEAGLEAAIDPHICTMNLITIKNRFRMAIRILLGYRPYKFVYTTDNEDDPYVE